MSDLKIYIDGEFKNKSEAAISVFDHGLLYGDGIFEGIRAYNGRIFRLKEHVDRFFYAAKAIMLELEQTKREVMDIVIKSCHVNNISDGYIRLVATRGVGDLGLDPRKCSKPSLFCIADKINVYPPEMYEKGISVITASQRRNNATIIDPQIKSLNYLNNILAKIEANRAGVPEAIMLNQFGVVAECTADNIFIVKDEVIYTPPIYCGALDGITHRTIMELAKEAGYEVIEKEFTQFNVYNADECFLTGTGAECIAVTNADGRIIGDGVAGPITKKLLELFHAYVRTQGEEIKDK